MPYIPTTILTQGGGAGAMTQLAQTLVGVGGAATIDHASIAQTYRDLRLVLYGAGDTAAQTVDIFVQYNGDTGTNYDYTNTGGAGAGSQSSAQIGTMVAATATDAASIISIDVPFYTDTRWFHLTRSQYEYQVYGVGSGWNQIKQGYKVKVAISRITITPQAGNFAQGTVSTLYGIGS